MRFTPLRVFFAVLSVTILFLMESEVYRDWFKCSNHSHQRSDASTAGMEELNSTRFKKRDPASPKDMKELFDGVETFVMFIGYPRSGHSLIASLLDAHPEIIIPHEYHMVEKWKRLFDSKSAVSNKVKKYKLFYELYSLSENQALFLKRSPIYGRDYSYHVPGTWQGTYKTRIQVIGDKKGGSTSVLPPSKLLSFFEELESVIEMPLKLIHVVRNPFDNIATIAIRALKSRESVRNSSTKINNSAALDKAISFYFKMVFTNKVVSERLGNTVLYLKSHETIQRPRETIQKLCDHLMVTCYQEYVEACVNILYNEISATRNKVVWTDEQKERVLKEMKNYWFLKDFNFEDIP